MLGTDAVIDVSLGVLIYKMGIVVAMTTESWILRFE